MAEGLKLRTARTMKWNVIDRLSQQVLYAITGIVLARELTQADFGLVGAVLIFQAFANLLVDSGFSSALLQRKAPTRLDYSSVLWFNLLVAAALYAILWVCAPLIAQCFENDQRLIPLSRVMFLSFILNAAAIVQTNRFMKEMNVRPVAMSNAIGLAAGAVVGIWLAVSGCGAWAIVWQTIVAAAVKTSLLWIISRWTPLLRLSWHALRSFMSVGLGMMFTSLLNTIFLNLYSFFIGNRVGLVSLGYYTQSDKWSKMGSASISQVLTSTFVPVLSSVQDDAPRFRRMVRRMNRVTAYITVPAMLGLAVLATPLFHTLFGAKWDPSILLFRILLIRGIFVVLNSLYGNYMLALGRSKAIVAMETVRDVTAVIALAVTFPYMAIVTPTDPVWGVTVMLWGQLAATVISWIVALVTVSRITGVSAFAFVTDNLPYLALTLVAAAPVIPLLGSSLAPWLQLFAGFAAGLAVYLIANFLLRSRVQSDAIAYFRGRL
ncbi:MAG: lipopolysaccharide biosynthesis protein [Bacteroidales bacterium]|nr:lipopolysaccharide biosynthesis protein [Bacteroidales bacterium]MDY2916259.1 lipopolysaccharide biosynthesis protein [Muribaculaceae bacterium]